MTPKGRGSDERDRLLACWSCRLTRLDEPSALGVATRLRHAGVDVEVDLRRRGVQANLRHADRERIPYVVIVGERERESGQPILRDMQARTEQPVAPESLLAAVGAGR